MSKFENAILQGREDVLNTLRLDENIAETKKAKKKVDEAIVQVVKEILKENE